MAEVTTGYCTEPCNGCPWRTDTTMSILPEAEELCGSDIAPLMPDAPMMPCHKTPPDGKDQNLCAAWLALYGIHHMMVRMMISNGKLPAHVLQVKPEWPELHADVESIIKAHGLSGVA